MKSTKPSNAVIFMGILKSLREIAFEHGYALAIHGSMERDFDLVAVPWIVDAKPAADLVEAMRLSVGGIHLERDRESNNCPEAKPHGRLAWSIYFGGGPYDFRVGPYIDISVMPRVPS